MSRKMWPHLWVHFLLSAHLWVRLFSGHRYGRILLRDHICGYIFSWVRLWVHNNEKLGVGTNMATFFSVGTNVGTNVPANVGTLNILKIH